MKRPFGVTVLAVLAGIAAFMAGNPYTSIPWSVSNQDRSIFTACF